ncbi:unnamed protein product, partial [Oppiella nova]
IWDRTLRLVKNPLYVCYVLGTTARLFAVLGYMTFKSKYIESEYKTSASTANLFSGIIGVVPTAAGVFLGGLFIRKFLPGPRVLTAFVTIVEMIGAMGLLSAVFLGCPQSQFAGTTLQSQFELQSQCNSRCQCSTKLFQPICGPDNITNYFSPCFAGCQSQSINSTANVYSDCDCFEGSATDGYCDTDCGNNFHIYITLLGISGIIGCLAKTGNNIISFRIVRKEDKSFSIGLMTVFWSIFAFIYPLVYGAVADASCLIWESSCGQGGHCWAYDTPTFRRRLHGLTLGLYFVGSLFDVIVIFLSSRIKNLYDDDIDGEESDSLSDTTLNTIGVDRHLNPND